jgi:prepilin peptidase CpaA
VKIRALGRLLGPRGAKNLPERVLSWAQNGAFSTTCEGIGNPAPKTGFGAGLKTAILTGAVLLSVIAGITDFRSRRIPNWLTAPALFLGVALNTVASGVHGLKVSLLGAGLGLLLLLPFVLLRSLGAGDWKLAGALGAFVGPGVLADLLMGSVFVAGIMALGLVIYKGRLRETMRNMGRLLASLGSFHMPGQEVSLDNPQALKVPYGVALASTVVLYYVLYGLGRAPHLGWTA